MRADVEAILQPDDELSHWARLEATVATMRTVDFSLEEIDHYLSTFVIPRAKELRLAVKKARTLERRRTREERAI